MMSPADIDEVVTWTSRSFSSDDILKVIKTRYLHSILYTLYRNEIKLAATLRGSWQGVQSASLIMTSLITS